MKIRNFVLGAAAALVTMVSCENTEQNLGAPKLTLEPEEMTFEAAGGEQSVSLTATRDWIVEDYKADWVVLSSEGGSASAEPQTVSVSVLPNEGMDREVSIKFTIGMASRYLTVKQAGPGGSASANIVYYNDFDKEEAVKGDSGWSTYLDSFDGWKNAVGTGAENCGFSAKGITARTNSGDGSAGKYSVYEGSGMNYLWFAKENHFAVTNITLDPNKTNYTLSFGTERYEYGVDDNTFKPEEYKVYISADAKKWVELKYEFSNGFQNGKWDLASTTFTLPANTSVLNVYFTATIASVYALDDLKLIVAGGEGTAVDFSTGIDIEIGSSTGGGNNGGGEVTPPENIKDVTVAEFLAAPVSTTDWYRLTGKVGDGNINTTYGNFDLVDETGQVYVYGISNWADYKSKVAKGGSIVVVGQRGVYEQKDGTLKDEVLEGYIESYDGSTATGGGNEGGNEGGGNNPPAGEPGEYDPQGITWTLGSSAYDNTSGQNAQTAVVNGVAVNNLLKLGTGSKVGDATLHVPAGTKKVGAYVVAWKGKTATLKFSVAGTEVGSLSPRANDSATGNPPYPEFTLTADDYYEIEVNTETALDVKIETTDPANGRVIIIALKAITE